MKKEKCVICLQEWGRRSCQMKEAAFICSHCCVKMRGASSCDGCSHFAQAEKYQAEKQRKTGFRDFMAEIDPEVDDAVDRALRTLESGDVARAKETMNGLIREYPHFHTVQFGMGVVHALQGAHEESIICFDKAIKIFPYFPEAWFNKSNSHKELLNLAGAINSSLKVVEYGDPKTGFVKDAKKFLLEIEKQIAKDSGMTIDGYIANMEAFEAAFAKMENGAFGEAKEGFLGVLENDPKHVQSFGNLALCYSFLGERQKSLDAFNQALLIDPTYAPAKQNKAILMAMPEGENLPNDEYVAIDYVGEKFDEKRSLETKKRWWKRSSK